MIDLNSKETILKTIRLEAKNFELLNELAEADKISLDSMINQALDEWLEAKAKTLLQEQIQNQKRETSFDYDEFWEGVDLD